MKQNLFQVTVITIPILLFVALLFYNLLTGFTLLGAVVAEEEVERGYYGWLDIGQECYLNNQCKSDYCSNKYMKCFQGNLIYISIYC